MTTTVAAHGDHGHAMQLAADAERKHHFTIAEHHLRAVLAENPRDAGAWLKLASLETVRGELSTARVACARTARPLGPLVALACRGRIALAGGIDARKAFDALLVLLEHPAVRDRRDELALWAWGVAAELAASLGETALADRLFAAALAGRPAVHLEAAYLDHLIASGRAGRVLEYVHPDDTELARRLRRVLALRAVASAPQAPDDRYSAREFSEQIRALDRLFRRWMEEGDFTHGREMAMFYHQLKVDPERARQAATQNMRYQREKEDRQLLETILMTGDDASS